MIRVATIGTSSITRRTVAVAAGVPGLRFTTAFSRDAATAAALASDLGFEHSTDDLAALLASDDIDAVYVASPNSVHAGQVRAAIEAGKHVFCEKPAVQTVAEWDAIVALAATKGVVLMENIRTQYDPVMARIEELLPTLGPIRRVYFALSQRSSRYDDVLAGRRVNIFDPAMGGGALADLGIYLVHPLARLFGTPSRTSASFVTVPTGADGAGAALFTYPGMVAEVAWSKITAGPGGGSIEGELGTLTVDHLTELYGIEVAYLDGRHLSERPDDKPDNITFSLARFADLVSGDGSAAVDQARTRAALGLLESIRAAAGSVQ